MSSSLRRWGRDDIPNRFTALKTSAMPHPNEKYGEQRHSYRKLVRSEGSQTKPSCREKLDGQRSDGNGAAGPVHSNLYEAYQYAETPKNLTSKRHGRTDTHDECGYAKKWQSERQR